MDASRILLVFFVRSALSAAILWLVYRYVGMISFILAIPITGPVRCWQSPLSREQAGGLAGHVNSRMRNGRIVTIQAPKNSKPASTLKPRACRYGCSERSTKPAIADARRPRKVR